LLKGKNVDNFLKLINLVIEGVRAICPKDAVVTEGGLKQLPEGCPTSGNSIKPNSV